MSHAMAEKKLPRRARGATKPGIWPTDVLLVVMDENVLRGGSG